jgi:DNA-binding Xre family transcriptional regulator
MVDYPKGELTVKSRLKQLIAQKEMEIGQRIQQKEIAEATGLDENTISRWMSPKPFQRLETRPVVELCRWLKCGLDDLLYIDPGSY